MTLQLGALERIMPVQTVTVSQEKHRAVQESSENK